MRGELDCVDVVKIIEQKKIFMAGAAEQTKRKRL
jgi:hypothetical protein